MKYRSLFVTIQLLCSLTSAQFRISEPIEVQTFMPAQFPCDAVCATVRQSNGTIQFYSSSYDRTYRYTGTIEKPWQHLTKYMNKEYFEPFTTYAQKHTSEYAFDHETIRYRTIKNATDRIGIYFKNIYKINETELVGFVHVEYYNQGLPPLHSDTVPYPSYYSIGICYSDNNGSSWRFCGDIIRPFVNYMGDRSYNIGGAPCLMVGNYIYCYFNESDASPFLHPAVARAKIAAVVDSARQGKICQWKKWTGDTTWNGEACGVSRSDIGQGKSLFPDTLSKRLLDMHTDATYCTTAKKYLLLMTIHDTLNLYQSTDALAWTKVQQIASVNLHLPGSVPRFPFFVAQTLSARDDFFTVNEAFSIFFINMQLSPENGCPQPRGSKGCYGGFRNDGFDFPLWKVMVTYPH